MSSFGKLLRVTTFGESHSQAIGCIVEGFPAQFKIKEEDIQKQLDRRRPGQSSLTTKRQEKDKVQILSGLENGVSLGTPISMIIMNEDQIQKDYQPFSQIPRPGHADYTYLMKYGVKSDSGGGRSSARETAARVCAGALADIYLKEILNIKIIAFVSSIGDMEIPKDQQQKYFSLTKNDIDQQGSFKIYNKGQQTYYQDYENKLYDKEGKYVQDIILSDFIEQEIVNVRCPVPELAIKMIEKIKQVKNQKDSIGGIVTCVIQNVPPGLGEPCFDKIQALLAHAMLSIPATKGFEIGSGFEGTKMSGSQHNDQFKKKIFSPQQQQEKEEEKHSESNQFSQQLQTKSNHAGGTLGGISNGEDIYFRVAFKPVSTIGLPQQTCDYQGEDTILEAKGRHDPCVLPRAPPIVESMAALVIMDAYMIQNANKSCIKNKM